MENNNNNNNKGISTGTIAGIVIAIVVVVSIVSIVIQGYKEAENANTSSISSDAYPTKESKTLTKEEYMGICTKVDYDILSRNPQNYNRNNLVISGKIIQSTELNGETVLRIDIDGVSGNTILASIKLSQNEDRILENDYITIWGECQGATSYESVLGAKITLPYIIIRYFTIEDKSKESLTVNENGEKVLIYKGLKITFSDKIEKNVAESYLYDEKTDVIRIPITIENISGETTSLNQYDIYYFGSSGNEVKSYNSFFDDGRETFDKLRSGSVKEGALYTKFDGNGTYVISFDNGYREKATEVEIDVSFD